MYDFIIVIAILILILSYSLKNKISLDDTSIVIFILLLIYSIYNNLSYYYILICFVFIIVLHSNSYNSTINNVKYILNSYYEKYIGLNNENNLNIENCDDDCCIDNDEKINMVYNDNLIKTQDKDYYDKIIENYNNDEYSDDEDIRSMFSIDTDKNIDSNENTNE